MRCAWTYTPRRRWSGGTLRPRRLEHELARIVAGRCPGAQVVELLRAPRQARSSWCIEDLRVRLDDGHAVRLVWKDLDREAPLSRARGVKPARVVDPRREPWVYDALLSPGREGAPCWGTVSDDHDGVHWLFLEPVPGMALCETGDHDAWTASARWLGSFHARHQVPPPDSDLLIRHDAELYDWWFCRALALGERRAVDFLGSIAPVYRMAAARVLDSARTLLHGEFYPANVLVTPGTPAEVVPVDWEMAGIGPAVLDLAALVSGGWHEEERASMVRAYRAARVASGMLCPAAGELDRILDAATLLLAVQWLAWSPPHVWRPPAELRTDWLGEAIRAAERLAGR